MSSPNPLVCAPVTGQPAPNLPSVLPWWRHGMLWLVIATPSIAVAASVAVAVLAWQDAEAELGVALAVERASSSRGADPGLRAKIPTAPALQARNHAATPRP